MNIICEELENEGRKHDNPYIELLSDWISYGSQDQHSELNEIVHSFRQGGRLSGASISLSNPSNMSVSSVLKLCLKKDRYFNRIFKRYCCFNISGSGINNNWTDECMEWLIGRLGSLRGPCGRSLVKVVCDIDRLEGMVLCDGVNRGTTVYRINLMSCLNSNGELALKYSMEESFNIAKENGIFIVKDCHGDYWESMRGYIDEYALRVGYARALENKSFCYIKIGG